MIEMDMVDVVVMDSEFGITSVRSLDFSVSSAWLQNGFGVGESMSIFMLYCMKNNLRKSILYSVCVPSHYMTISDGWMSLFVIFKVIFL